MTTWSECIENAFLAIYYGGGYEAVIETFARRWGSLTVETFQHVLKVGEGEDKLIALCAIGYTGTKEAQGLVLPFLHSTDPKERWASALCLGEMKDEEAFPVLLEMLQETFPLQRSASEKRYSWDEDEGWYGYHQVRIPYLLGTWRRSLVVPLLRQTLLRSWELEQHEFPLRFWRLPYQEALASALGQLGAFGALTDLSLSQQRLRYLMVHVAYGYYVAQKDAQPHYLRTTMPHNRDLQKTIAALLAQQFGLSHEEQVTCMHQVAPGISLSDDSVQTPFPNTELAPFPLILNTESEASAGESGLLFNQRQSELLKKGVDFWNAWREQHTDIKIRLVGEDLSGIDIREADLSGADLSEANLSGANLSGAELYEATLKWANASGANFHDANCSFADISGADLHGIDFSHASLASANLSGANMRRANLQEASMNYAHFHNAHLHEACLREADITMSYLNWAILKKADLSGANLELANLSGADLSEADLSGAILRRADLSGANLESANLSGADLTGANVNGTIFHQANLSGAILNGTNLDETHSN